MKISELIKKELSGKEIEGRDREIYKISVISGLSSFSVWVINRTKSNLYGFLEEIRVRNKELYLSVMADFTRISGKGLYKETIKLLSEAMPKGTSFRSELANSQDRENLLSYIEEKKKNKEEIQEKEAVSKTIFGHVLLNSFREVIIEYKPRDGSNISGVEALEKFRSDRSDQRNNKMHDKIRQGYLYFVGKK